MTFREPFSIDEWYHCYNRGVDKRIVFEDELDYDRFLRVMYLANSTEPFRLADLDHLTLKEILALSREQTLVSMGAFSLMPNHFHLLIKERIEGGITAFMRKLGTAYTMYFNTKRERVGNLFVKPFRSRHVDSDIYFQHGVRYIHCNAAELYESTWKDGSVRDLPGLISKLVDYPYSSLGCYEDSKHILCPLLDESVFEIVETVSAKKMINEAAEYYAQCSHLTR